VAPFLFGHGVYFLKCIRVSISILYLNTLKRIVPITAIKKLVADPSLKE